MSKFNVDDVVRHERTGHEYIILQTPEVARIEAGPTPAYIYESRFVSDDVWWIRPQSEMEDGRFTLLSRPTVYFALPARDGEGPKT